MRSTPVIALAALLVSLPARAVELIDLHDPVQRGAYSPAHLPAHLRDHMRNYRIDYPVDYLFGSMPGYLPGTLLGEEWGVIAAVSTAGMPQPAEGGPAAQPAEGGPTVTGLEATPVPIPVPEPVSVLMLACGLLLMMPGALAARWSRLGDSESLLQRRLP